MSGKLGAISWGFGMQINTVGVGVAIGQSCMILSAGTKGKRFMLPHATGNLSACFFIDPSQHLFYVDGICSIAQLPPCSLLPC